MGFQKFTTGILARLYENTKIYNLLQNAKSVYTGDTPKFDVIAFDANAFYYMITSLFDSIQIEQVALATVSIMLRIIKHNLRKDGINRKLIIISFDGTPPASKLTAQISRRLDDNESANMEIYIAKLTEYNSNKVKFQAQGNTQELNKLKKPTYREVHEINKDTHSSFDSMQKYVTYCYKLLIGIAQTLKIYNSTIRFHIETSRVAGEGEHKIFDYLLVQEDLKDSRFKKLIVSDDSDLFLISASRMPLSGITILRRTIGVNTNYIPDNQKVKTHTTETLLNTTLKDFLYLVKKMLKGREDAALSTLIMLYGNSKDLTKVYNIGRFLGKTTYTSTLYNTEQVGFIERLSGTKDITLDTNINFQYLDLRRLEFYLISNIKLTESFEQTFATKSKILNRKGMRDVIRNNCAFFMLLASFIGNDFTAKRFDIQARDMIYYIDGIFNLNIQGSGEKSRFLELIDCSAGNRRAFFSIINFEAIMEEFYAKIPNSSIKEPKAIISNNLLEFIRLKSRGSVHSGIYKNMDDILVENMKSTEIDIVKLYFQSIAHTIEYIMNGLSGGSKSFYSTMPWAPSFHMIRRVMTASKIPLSPLTLPSLQNKTSSMSTKFMSVNGIPRSNLWHSIVQISKVSSVDSTNISNYMTDEQVADIFKVSIAYLYIRLGNKEIVKSNLNTKNAKRDASLPTMIERSLIKSYPYTKSYLSYIPPKSKVLMDRKTKCILPPDSALTYIDSAAIGEFYSNSRISRFKNRLIPISICVQIFWYKVGLSRAKFETADVFDAGTASNEIQYIDLNY